MRHALTLMWNYLRVRGEYRDSVPEDRLSMELPPRTRRILMDLLGQVAAKGTTSAHAENTVVFVPTFFFRWNYLRARGEYI